MLGLVQWMGTIPSKQRQRLLVASVLCSISFSLVSYAKPDLSDPALTSTKITEITKWEDFPGGQYTLGYCIDTEQQAEVPCAIYDKTFSNPAGGTFWARAMLGTFGVGDVTVLSKFEAMQKKKLAKKTEQLNTAIGNELATMGLKTEDLSDLGFILDDEMHVSDADQERATHTYPADWWKNPNLRWKAGKQPNPNGPAPAHIPLDYLEIGTKDEASSHMEKLFEYLAYLFSSLSKEEAQRLLPQMLHNMQFEQLTDGSYLLLRKKDTMALPTKVIDLKGYRSSLGKAGGWAVAALSLRGGLAAIPCPIVAEVTCAYVERMMNMMEVVFLLRHARALSLIMDARSGNMNSPFANLNADQLEKSIFYATRANTMISSLLVNLFTKNEDQVRKYLKGLQKTKVDSLFQLQARGYRVYPLDESYYALALKRDENDKVTKLKLFALAKQSLFRKRPDEVVDFMHPEGERTTRMMLDTVFIGTNFIRLALPGIITVIRFVYKEVFIRNMQRRQMQEAGFKAHLTYNENEMIQILMQEGYTRQEAQAYVKQAYKIIEDNEINPLDLKGQEEEEYAIKVENWLHEHFPEYQPWRGTLPLSEELYSVGEHNYLELERI